MAFATKKQRPQGLQIEPGVIPAATTKAGKDIRVTGWQALLLSLFGIAIALVLTEVAYRIFTRSSATTVNREDRPDRYYIPYNAKSNRDFSFSPTKPPGIYRVAVIGDSFTFGVEMQFDDTFPKRLERMMNYGRKEPIVEVLNIGVPGYSSVQEENLVKRAIGYQADLILVQVTLNDPEGQPFRVTHKGFDANGHPKLTAPLFNYWKSLGFVVTRVLNTLSHETFKDYYFNLFNDSQNWGRFEKAFAEFKKLSDAHGVHLGVVVFPLFSHRLDSRYPFQPIHDKIEQMLESKGIPHLDLLSSYRNIAETRLQIAPGRDSHPNEIAHRIAAEAIYRWLFSKRVVERRYLTTEFAKTRRSYLRKIK